MGILDSIRLIFKPKEPKRLGNISIYETLLLLNGLCKPENIFLSDSVYGITSTEEAKKFTEETMVSARQWVAEKHDCDNFSFALMGYWSQGLENFCFGIAWSNVHAFNIMIDDKKQVFIVEPQSNKYIPIEEAKRKSLYYPIRLIVI